MYNIIKQAILKMGDIDMKEINYDNGIKMIKKSDFVWDKNCSRYLFGGIGLEKDRRQEEERRNNKE